MKRILVYILLLIFDLSIIYAQKKDTMPDFIQDSTEVNYQKKNKKK